MSLCYSIIFDDDACGIFPGLCNTNQTFSVVDIGCAITQRFMKLAICSVRYANVENDSSTVAWFQYGHRFNQGQTNADRS